MYRADHRRSRCRLFPGAPFYRDRHCSSHLAYLETVPSFHLIRMQSGSSRERLQILAYQTGPTMPKNKPGDSPLPGGCKTSSCHDGKKSSTTPLFCQRPGPFAFQTANPGFKASGRGIRGTSQISKGSQLLDLFVVQVF